MTCPSCGALITPQLSRCRRCKTYLHGSALEGVIVEHLLPPSLRASPATGLLVLIIGFYYVMMAGLAGFSDILAFSGFSLRQLGATHGPSNLLGQHWRFVTSVFAHHDLVHLAFNLWALTAVGPVVERIFDRKKAWLTFFLSGVGSMMASHIWYTSLTDGVLVTSAGASGAVCGLIGAALVGGRRMGSEGRAIASLMSRWAIYMVVWGLMVPGINNAAHGGGFVLGAAIAALWPLGLPASVAANRALSMAVGATLLVVIGSVTLMADNLRGYPARLEHDMQPGRLLMFTVREGADWSFSSQRVVAQTCSEAAKGDPQSASASDEMARACELHLRVSPHDPAGYMLLAAIAETRGETERAQRLRAVGRRIAERVATAGSMGEDGRRTRSGGVRARCKDSGLPTPCAPARPG